MKRKPILFLLGLTLTLATACGDNGSDDTRGEDTFTPTDTGGDGDGDGNDDNTDGCLNTCEIAACGDGYVWAGEEACDDGNDDNTDECLDTCVAASCGDGYVWANNEDCDDQNDDNTDDCIDTCVSASCGDGFIWGDNEECDDGNDDDDDECTNVCELPVLACAGDLIDPGNNIVGCWYTAEATGMTCAEVCADHGGFNAEATQHTGNEIGKFFWPQKSDGNNWVNIECSSTDNNTNWGADGQNPDPNWSHNACHVNCACME